jgi:hypothetical protein
VNAARHRRMLARVEWTRDSACRSFSGSDRWDLLSMPEYDPAHQGISPKRAGPPEPTWTAWVLDRRRASSAGVLPRMRRAVRLWCAASEKPRGLAECRAPPCDPVWLARQPRPPEGQGRVPAGSHISCLSRITAYVQACAARFTLAVEPCLTLDRHRQLPSPLQLVATRELLLQLGELQSGCTSPLRRSCSGASPCPQSGCVTVVEH